MSPPVSHRRVSPFRIETSPVDPEELAGFFASQTGETAERIRERLDWQLRNPACRPDLPSAIVARAASGAIGGAMLCIPHRLTNGADEQTIVMSSGFYVDRALRAAGLHLFLRFRALARRFVLYATTASPQAAEIWKWAGAQPLAGTDGELFRPLRWRPVCEEALVRWFGRGGAVLARAVAGRGDLRALIPMRTNRAPRVELTPVDSAEAAVGTLSSAAWQPVRDAAFVRWRFFEVPQVDPRVYRVQDDRREVDAFIALTRSARGYRGQIRTVFVADIWGNLPFGALPAVLQAVGRHRRHRDDLLVIRGLPEPYARVKLGARWRRRRFEQPVGWYIDTRDLLGSCPFVMPAAASELV